jgi:Zn-dependent protease with chaperone function
MRHLPTRITFVLLPIVAMGCVQLLLGTTVVEPLTLVTTTDCEMLGIEILGVVAYVIYVLVVVAWLSRNMEYEADLYAIGAFDCHGDEVRESDGPQQLPHSQSMADALLRFAQYHPDQFNRRSWTHPSLLQRIDVITKVAASPNLAMKIRKRFVCRQLALGCLVLIAVPILMWASRCLNA